LRTAIAETALRSFRPAMPVVTYCPFIGLNTYYQDANQMKAVGCAEYSEFVKSVFGAVQKHAEEAGWLPVYWNIGDEPIGDNLTRSIDNADSPGFRSYALQPRPP
jgi:hypothetical protein